MRMGMVSALAITGAAIALITAVLQDLLQVLEAPPVVLRTR